MSLLRKRLAVLGAAALLGCGSPGPARTGPVAQCGGERVRATVLERANAARAAARSCGGQRMAPAAPLAWNNALASAAARHSADMARRDYFAHSSPEGKRARQRVEAEGYAWRVVGENIAGGDTTADAVMAGWIASNEHCRNIMDPVFAEVGVACVQRSGTTWGTYWTMVLGRRR
jgi:uncharacterized protein YkwD